MKENIAFMKHKQDAIKTQRENNNKTPQKDYSENKRNSWKYDSGNKNSTNGLEDEAEEISQTRKQKDKENKEGKI